MIIDCISDLHGEYPELEGGDLLIVAGDLTASDTGKQLMDFVLWIKGLRYKKVIVIAGNHDNSLKFNDECCVFDTYNDSHIQYLCDSGTEFEGLKIWGCPWTLWFQGINPHCKAFTCTENEMRKHLVKIPRDIDILVTHGPPEGIFDGVLDWTTGKTKDTGSRTLRHMVLDGSYFPNLKLHVFGHIHEHGGEMLDTTLCTFVNASVMNEDYDMVNKPVRIIL